jgi:hypothetical protein
VISAASFILLHVLTDDVTIRPPLLTADHNCRDRITDVLHFRFFHVAMDYTGLKIDLFRSHNGYASAAH